MRFKNVDLRQRHGGKGDITATNKMKSVLLRSIFNKKKDFDKMVDKIISSIYFEQKLFCFLSLNSFKADV